MKPTPAGLPAAPHPLRTLPPRVLPDPVPTAPVPAPTAPVPVDRAGPAGRPTAVASLTAAVAVRHGIALQRLETLHALLDLDDAGLAELVEGGTVLVVPLGAGRRYVLADAVPAAALSEAGAA